MFKHITIALLFCATALPACDETPTPADVDLRLLEGPAEVVVEVESPEFIGKMLGCFSNPSPATATHIEYRDTPQKDAVMMQTVEVCFASIEHVSVGSCLRDAMLDAGGVAP